MTLLQKTQRSSGDTLNPLSSNDVLFSELPHLFETNKPLNLSVQVPPHLQGQLEYQWMYQKSNDEWETFHDWDCDQNVLFESPHSDSIAFQVYIRDLKSKTFLLAKWVGQVGFVNYSLSIEDVLFSELPHLFETNKPLNLSAQVPPHLQGQLEYQWIYQKSNDEWEIFHDWDCDQNVLFESPHTDSIAFQVYIRDLKSKAFLLAKWVGQVGFVKLYNNIDDIKFSSLPSSLALDHSLEINVESKKGRLPSSFEYQWLIQKQGELWDIVQEWSYKPSLTFEPSQKGVYSFQALIREGNNYIMRKKWKENVSVTSLDH